MNTENIFSNDPQHVAESFFALKQKVESLEQHRAEKGAVPGYIRREFDVHGLPQKSDRFVETPRIRCVEYLTHGQVQDLPRQVRLSYRPDNGYSEALTYRDNFWTPEGAEVTYAIEFSTSKRGVLKRSAIYAKNGEIVHSDVTHIQLRAGKRF